MKCLGELDIMAAAALLVHIDGRVGTNFTRGHIDILIRISVTKDDAAQELRFAYQNISLRQSI